MGRGASLKEKNLWGVKGKSREDSREKRDESKVETSIYKRVGNEERKDIQVKKKKLENLGVLGRI